MQVNFPKQAQQTLPRNEITHNKETKRICAITSLFNIYNERVITSRKSLSD